MRSKKEIIARVLDLRNQAVISDHCVIAESFFLRAKGLLGRKSFAAGEGLLLSPCNNIHMWFMRIPIDVIFLKQKVRVQGKTQYVVSSVYCAIRPWKILPLLDMRAVDTLELPSGTILKHDIHPGDEICIS